MTHRIQNGASYRAVYAQLVYPRKIPLHLSDNKRVSASLTSLLLTLSAATACSDEKPISVNIDILESTISEIVPSVTSVNGSGAPP